MSRLAAVSRSAVVDKGCTTHLYSLYREPEELSVWAALFDGQQHRLPVLPIIGVSFRPGLYRNLLLPLDLSVG